MLNLQWIKMLNSKTSKRYSWDDVKVQYYDNDKKIYISYDKEYEILFRRMDEASLTMVSYVAGVYQSPEQNLADLADFIRTEVKNVHLQAAMLGRGGRGMMTQSDWGKVGSILKREYGFINNLIDDFYYGTITVGQLRARLQAYSNKANYTYHLMRAKAQKGAGRVRYMRVLNAKESCPTCPPKAGKWGDFESLELGLPADGNDACGSFCKCTVIFE